MPTVTHGKFLDGLIDCYAYEYAAGHFLRIVRQRGIVHPKAKLAPRFEEREKYQDLGDLASFGDDGVEHWHGVKGLPSLPFDADSFPYPDVMVTTVAEFDRLKHIESYFLVSNNFNALWETLPDSREHWFVKITPGKLSGKPVPMFFVPRRYATLYEIPYRYVPPE